MEIDSKFMKISPPEKCYYHICTTFGEDIVGYLCWLQLLLMYHKLVIFTVVLFTALNFVNGIKLYLQRLHVQALNQNACM